MPGGVAPLDYTHLADVIMQVRAQRQARDMAEQQMELERQRMQEQAMQRRAIQREQISEDRRKRELEQQKINANTKRFAAQMIEANPERAPIILDMLRKKGIEVDFAEQQQPKTVVIGNGQQQEFIDAAPAEKPDYGDLPLRLEADASSILGVQDRQKEQIPVDDIAKQVINMYGVRQGTPEFREKYGERLRAVEGEQKAKLGAERSEKLAGVTSELRKELQGQQTYKDTQSILAAHEKIKNSSPTGPGDMRLIFSYMKMLDPGSTVREGEFATAENAGGVPARITSLYNKAISGQMLSQDVRAQFKREADSIAKTQVGRYNKLAAQYRTLAGRLGANPDDVVLGVGFDQKDDNLRDEFERNILR